jgi:DNA-binding SARP family transcriptional activator
VSIALTLLADVRWRGRPVAGDRPQALLAALAARDCRPVRPEELIELVWGEDAPSNGPKSLQVLVAHAQSPQDEPLLADLLRSEAAVSGAATALERFERYRRDLRERLGADPGELLQRTHRSLLALVRPVRRGCATTPPS